MRAAWNICCGWISNIRDHFSRSYFERRADIPLAIYSSCYGIDVMQFLLVHENRSTRLIKYKTGRQARIIKKRGAGIQSTGSVCLCVLFMAAGPETKEAQVTQTKETTRLSLKNINLLAHSVSPTTTSGHMEANSHRYHCRAGNLQDNMASMAAANMVEIPSEYPRCDLEWSLQPISYMLRIYGVDLDMNQPRSVCRRCAFITLGMCHLVVSGFLGVYSIKIFLSVPYDPTSDFFYLVLNIVSKMIFDCSGLLATLLVSQLKWGSFWRALKILEHNCQLPARVYNRLRKALTTGIIFFSLLVFIARVCLSQFKSNWYTTLLSKEIFTIGLLVESKTGNGEFQHSDFSVEFVTPGKLIQTFVRQSNNSFILFYAYSTRFASESIQVLVDEVKTWTFATKGPLIHRISKCKKMHALISCFIKEIEGFFGPSMLPIFASIFTNIIFMGYQLIALLLKQTYNDALLFLINFVRAFIILSFLVSGTETMKSKVSSPKNYSSFHITV